MRALRCVRGRTPLTPRGAHKTVEQSVSYERLESVLQALANFRREYVDATTEETEVAANLFNTLCSMLLRGGPLGEWCCHECATPK